MKLCDKSERFMEKILQYYPMKDESNKQNTNTVPEHKIQQSHMHDYRKEREIYDKPTTQKIQNMKFFKEEGNNHYKNSRFQEAAYFYQKVIIYGDYTFPDQQKDTIKMEELIAQANCNLALCSIKMGEWEKSKTNLVQASKSSVQSIKAKALYWLTKYHIRKSESQLARQTLLQLKELGSSYNNLVGQLQIILNEMIKTMDKQQRELCSSMFQK